MALCTDIFAIGVRRFEGVLRRVEEVTQNGVDEWDPSGIKRRGKSAVFYQFRSFIADQASEATILMTYTCVQIEYYDIATTAAYISNTMLQVHDSLRRCKSPEQHDFNPRRWYARRIMLHMPARLGDDTPLQVSMLGTRGLFGQVCFLNGRLP